MARDRRGELLLEQIASSPEDDQLRRVYADHLIERGDPRGDFIVLQLAGGDPKRAQTLLDQHAVSWLGAIAPLVRAATDRRHYRFARGFPFEIQLCEHPATSGRCDGFEESLADPIWATVTRLQIFEDRQLAMLRRPALRGIRHLGGLSHAAMRELLAWDAIPYVTLNAFMPDPDIDPRRQRADFALLLDAQPKLAALRVLELYARHAEPSEFRWIWKSWLGGQLECFGAAGGLYSFASWLRELVRAPKLRSLRLSSEDIWQEWIEISRDASGKFSVAEVGGTDPLRGFSTITRHLPNILSNLPPRTIETLRFTAGMPARRDLPAIEDACADAGVVLELPAKPKRR